LQSIPGVRVRDASGRRRRRRRRRRRGGGGEGEAANLCTQATLAS
jgi:hypothetical protein